MSLHLKRVVEDTWNRKFEQIPSWLRCFNKEMEKGLEYPALQLSTTNGHVTKSPTSPRASTSTPYDPKRNASNFNKLFQQNQNAGTTKCPLFVDFDIHVLRSYHVGESQAALFASRYPTKNTLDHTIDLEFSQYFHRSCMRIQGHSLLYVPFLDFGHVTAIGFFRSRKSGIFKVPACLLC